MGHAAYNAPSTGLSQPHLLGIDQLSQDDITAILDRADHYADQLAKGPFTTNRLQDRLVLTLFFENSTRTRTSFDIAIARTGARAINWDVSSSALKKGESFLDTILYLDAMKPDAIIMRHSEYGAPGYMAAHVNCAVINAGDSWREHPTQALLDALTIRRHKGALAGLRVAICGDIAHSRVARSNMILLRQLGAEVRAVAPPPLMPDKFPADNIQPFTTLAEGIKDCDIVMMLRYQKERMDREHLSPQDIAEFCLTPEILTHAAKDVMVMHPGPMNRGMEISDDVADDPAHSLIFEQAKMGVPVRMAVLELLLENK